MPTGPGGLDANGVWQYGEDDTEALASDLLNLGMSSISTEVGLLDAAVAAIVTGQILQVVSTTKTLPFSTTARDTWTDITGLSVAITPGSTTSKVALSVDLGLVDASLAAQMAFRFVRDSTPVGIGTSVSSRVAASFGLVVDTPGRGIPGSGSFIDSPSTTSEITYKLQMYNGDIATAFLNTDHDDTDAVGTTRTISTITVMEVAG